LFPTLKEHRGEDLKEALEIINEKIAPIIVGGEVGGAGSVKNPAYKAGL